MIFEETAHHPAGEHFHFVHFNTAARHAAVLGLDNNGYTARFKVLPNAVGNFSSQTLLHLQAVRETMEDAGEF